MSVVRIIANLSQFSALIRNYNTLNHNNFIRLNFYPNEHEWYLFFKENPNQNVSKRFNSGLICTGLQSEQLQFLNGGRRTALNATFNHFLNPQWGLLVNSFYLTTHPY